MPTRASIVPATVCTKNTKPRRSPPRNLMMSEIPTTLSTRDTVPAAPTAVLFRRTIGTAPTSAPAPVSFRASVVTLDTLRDSLVVLCKSADVTLHAKSSAQYALPGATHSEPSLRVGAQLRYPFRKLGHRATKKPVHAMLHHVAVSVGIRGDNGQLRVERLK